MSKDVKGFQVGNNVKLLDYNFLSNKPKLVEIDNSLSISGKAADAKVTGDRLSTMDSQVKENNRLIVDITDKVNDMAGSSAIKTNVNGEFVSVSDSNDAPIQGLVLYGKSKQNGTPTLDSPVAIKTSGTDGSIDFSIYGKNLFDERWEKGRLNSGGPVADDSGTYWRTSSFIPFDQRLKFFAKFENLISEYRLYCYDENKNYVGLSLKYAFNDLGGTAIDIRTKYVRIYATLSSPVEDINTAISHVMITFATDGIYEAYKEPQILPVSTPGGLYGVPVSSGGNYTDSSGQWLCNEIDFKKGVFIQRFASVDLGTLPWSAWTARVYANTSLNTIIKRAEDQAIPVNALCSAFAVNSYFVVVTSQAIPGICVSSSGTVAAYVGADTTLEAFMQAVSGQTLIYELATPIERPLSAEEIAAASALRTYKPYTTALAEGAGINLEYVADTKAYIDNKFAELSTAILNG